MAVVKHLNALRRGLKVKSFGDIFQQAALIVALGNMTGQCLARVLRGHVDQRLFAAALWAVQGNFAARPQRQCLSQKRDAGHFFADQNQRRCGPLVIELTDKGFQNFSRATVAVMAWEVSLIAKVLSGAEKENLNARSPALIGNGNDIGLANIGKIDIAFLLNISERANAVARGGGPLKIEIGAGGFHFFDKLILNRAAIALQKIMGLPHQLAIIGRANLARTRRAAAFYLI